MKPLWLIKAESYEGITETENMAEIQGWIDETDGNTEREPWCADFVNHCLNAVGVPGSGSPAAASFLNWGVDMGERPVPGCVVVFHWSGGSDAGGHHVTFYEGPADDDNIICLGGNQNRMVKRSTYTVADVQSYRMPA